SRISHNEEIRLEDRMGAESYVTRCLSNLDPESGLEPLAPGVHQADERDWCPADVSGQSGEVVIFPFRQCVEDLILIERSNSLFLVERRSGDDHKAFSRGDNGAGALAT